jgi:cytochrome c-type biogenesis protein
MDVFQWILIPLAFGLIGFIEPCSVGANLVFLSYMNKMENKKQAWLEAIKFTLSRSLFLGIIGLMTAYLGQQLSSLQHVYNFILGASFIVLGILYLLRKQMTIRWPVLDWGQFLEKRKGRAVTMGIIFGLSAPACSAPLLLVLIGQSATLTLVQGFVSLFLFGLALSLPLLVISRYDRAREIIKKMSKWVVRTPIPIGIVLLLIGLYTSLQGLK